MRSVARVPVPPPPLAFSGIVRNAPSMRNTHRLPRVPAALACVVVLTAGLTACSSDETTAADFCESAEQLEQNQADVDLTDSDQAISALRASAEEARGISAPPEIADDWDVMVTGITNVVDALDGVDLEDPAALQEAIGSIDTEGLDAATENVSEYMDANCTTETP